MIDNAELLQILRAMQADIAVVKEHTNAIEMLRQDVGLIRLGQAAHTQKLTALHRDLESVKDRVEILTGAAIRNDGTAQELSGIRNMLDHLDKRVRKLEDQGA